MPALKHTKIYRGGVTASRLVFETRECELTTRSDHLSFDFAIASKGGGWTAVQLHLGKADIPELLATIGASSSSGTRLLAEAIVESEARRNKSLTVELNSVLRSLERVEPIAEQRVAASGYATKYWSIYSGVLSAQRSVRQLVDRLKTSV